MPDNRGTGDSADAEDPLSYRCDRLDAPVLIHAGALDAAPTPEVAAAGSQWFPHARVIVQPGAAHFPWLDDAGSFTVALSSFLQD